MPYTEEASTLYSSDEDKESGEDDSFWLRDSNESWLEKWWNQAEICDNVKSRIKSKQMLNGRITMKESNHARNQIDIIPITLSEFVLEESVAKDIYSVRLNAPRGLGLKLIVTINNKVIVQALNNLSDGKASPAQECGLISIGDQLIKANEIEIEHLNLHGIAEVLKDLDIVSKVCSFEVIFWPSSC